MLLDPLFKHAGDSPSTWPITDDRGRYTYQQLAADGCGLGFISRCRPASRGIGILLPGSAGSWPASTGRWRPGKTVVPINFLLANERSATSSATAASTPPPLRALGQDGAVASSGLKVIDIARSVTAVRHAHAPATDAGGERSGRPHVHQRPSGLPKGVQLTYGNLDSDVRSAMTVATPSLTGQCNLCSAAAIAGRWPGHRGADVAVELP